MDHSSCFQHGDIYKRIYCSGQSFVMCLTCVCQFPVFFIFWNIFCSDYPFPASALFNCYFLLFLFSNIFFCLTGSCWWRFANEVVTICQKTAVHLAPLWIEVCSIHYCFLEALTPTYHRDAPCLPLIRFHLQIDSHASVYMKVLNADLEYFISAKNIKLIFLFVYISPLPCIVVL